jgi:CheY-like chemotaxis protein
VVLFDLSGPSNVANAAMSRLAREIREGEWPAVGLIVVHRRSTAAAFFAEACEATLSKPLAPPEPLQAALQQALKRARSRDTVST